MVSKLYIKVNILPHRGSVHLY